MRTKAQFRRLRYKSALDDNRAIPAWVDGVLEKAVSIDPNKRYESLSEFVFDLRHPNAKYLRSAAAPLLERNPLLFWRVVSVILAFIVLLLLIRLRH
jgi:ribosomal protein L39E